MDSLDRLLEALEEVSEGVGEPELEPNPARTDWREVEPQISILAELAKSSLVAPFDEAVSSIHDPEERRGLALAVGYLLGELAVLLQASSLHDGLPLLQDARRIGAGNPELDASTTAPGDFSKLVRGRWFLKQGDQGSADRIFKKLKASTRIQVFKDAAQEGLDAPRPMKGAPSLFSLNGFGICLYGDRDRHDDLSHVKTTYITALYVPLFPLAAYRVHDHGDSSYTFYAKQKLTTAARVWQALVPIGIAVTIGALWLADHYDSNRYKAKTAYAAAKKLEKGGKKQAARKAYEKLLKDYAEDADAAVVNGAAKRLVGLYSSDVKRPVTHGSVSQLELVVQRFLKLPRRAREGPASGAMTLTLEDWVTAIGSKTDRCANAGLEVLALAERVARDDDLRRVQVKRRTWLLTRAATVAPKWPLRALATYLAYPSYKPALDGAAKVLEGLVAHPFALLSEQELVRLWIRQVKAQPKHTALRKKVRVALKTALSQTQDPARRALLSKPHEKRLAAYLESHPGDQPVANALARLQRQRGASREAHATLSKLGGPGILMAAARLTLSSVYTDLGWLSKSSALLEAHLAGRMGRFQKAQRAYQRAAEDFRKSLVARARAGNLPAELNERMRQLTEADQSKAFGEWMSKQFRENHRLKQLRETYQAFGTVVPACLSLGMVKLRLARVARGAARAELLADAERLFLGIRAEAEGVASYHLALGQVYYRLGKKKQGEQELQSLLARAKAPQRLAVAKVYRQLGMVDRARKITEKEWENVANSKEERSRAASLMAVFADHLDDEEKWLKRADTSQGYVVTRLLEVQARRLINDGKLAQADALLAQAEQANAKQATHNSAAANNASITCQTRYWCTGNAKHLKRAYRYLDAAHRLLPDNTVIVTNLASLAQYVSGIEILGSLLPVHTLRLGSGEASELLGALANGPLRERIIKAMQSSPKLRRCLELTQQEEVLAPERVTGYRRELNQYTLTRNVTALGKLKARLLEQKQLQTDESARGALEYRAGKHDKRILKSYARNIRQRQRLVTAVARKSKATQASALLLLGSSYASRASLSFSVEDARRAIAAFQKADQAWPALGARNNVVWMQLRLALMELAAKTPALKKRWQRESRIYGLASFLHRLLSDAGAAPLVTAIVALPQLRQVLTARAESVRKRPSFGDWVVARMLKDEALIQVTSAVFKRPETRLSMEIDARLTPWSEADQLKWKIFRKHP